MLSYEIINNPSKGTINILWRKVPDEGVRAYLDQGTMEAVAIIQGPVVQMIAAADTAEKAADVIVTEVLGMCPQHITMIALFGTTSAVNIAIHKIKEKQEAGQ